MLSILGALVRGGGERIADEALAGMIEAQHLPAIISAISAVFAASFAESGATTADPC